MKSDMWENFPKDQKEKYRKLIINFSNLSEAFSQKSYGDAEVITPIVNSKYQETVFQYAFNATEEDIANTSFDASLIMENGVKYLVGLKSFGLSAGDQKIAQFKAKNDDWSDLVSKMVENAKSIPRTEKNRKKKIDEENKDLYLNLAKKIAELRNERIRSSREQLRGFKDEGDVRSVYHVLMPTVENDQPEIKVGETTYTEIDIDNLKVLGCTNANNPSNFKFTDGIHEYKYAAADSQLFMSFHNRDIIVDSWDVHYVKDALSFFESLDHKEVVGQMAVAEEPGSYYSKPKYESYSWTFIDKNGQVPTRSGINEFNSQSKQSKPARKKQIQSLIKKYDQVLSKEELTKFSEGLQEILLPEKSNSEFVKRADELKHALYLDAASQKNNAFFEDTLKLLYPRPLNEVYIPIPDSKKFHTQHPDFFGEGIGKNLFGEKGKIIKDQKDRTFIMRFMPSRDRIEGYIDQDGGKAIQSPKSQSILGKWIKKKIFQLEDYELLTTEKLNDLGINAIRFIKNTDEHTIDVEFFWMDLDNPPKDAIGWVAKNGKVSL